MTFSLVCFRDGFGVSRMGELSPVIEGHVKYREGKRWKSRFARVTRLSPVASQASSN